MERSDTAIHEAGHAVAFARLFPGHCAESVTIAPQQGLAGAFLAEDVSSVSISVPEEEAEEALLRHAIYSCAGYAAVFIEFGDEVRAQAGCSADFEEAGLLVEDGKIRAVELLKRPKNIAAVRRLAKELLKQETLDWETTDVLISVADGETTEAEFQEFVRLRSALTA